MNQDETPKTTRERVVSRRLLVGGAAGVAALSGVGVALWNGGPTKTSVAEPPIEGLWSMQWDTPRGGTVAIAAFKGRPLLVNFWATWCPPCVDELPLINDFYRQNKSNGWQVLGLAVDRLAPVQAFLQKLPLEFPIGMAGLSGAELGRSFGNVSGGLPFTVVIGSDGLVAQRKLGRVTAGDFSSWLRLK